MKILLIAATEAEIAPLIKHMKANWVEENSHFSYKSGVTLEYVVTGVGMLVTAYMLTKKLQLNAYDLVLQAGIAGSYNRNMNLGDVVWVKSEQLADLRVEDKDAYLNMFDLGFMQKDVYPFEDAKLLNNSAEKILPIDLKGISGVTVNTATGKESTVKYMQDKYECDVESMEGAALHYVCLMELVPFLQLRGISNYVEPRNRDAWGINTAILRVNNYLIAYLERI